MGSGELGFSWCWESAVKTGPGIAFGTAKMIAVSTSDSVVYSGDPTGLHRRKRVGWTEAAKDVVVSRCAGIDIGKAEVVVCLRIPGPRGKRVSQVRTFSAVAVEMNRLADWLAEHQVSHAVWRRPVRFPRFSGGF